MKKHLTIILILAGIMGCGKNDGPPPTPPVPPTPQAAVLNFPAQSEVCTTGTVLTDSTSSVTFKWKSAANADGYVLYLKNLITGTTDNQSTPNVQLAVTILRNTPYSWYVVSKSSTTSATAQSETWKFYNAGKGTVTYAPFPAEITAPTFGQSLAAGKVNLTWKGSSVNAGTIDNYDVYFGDTAVPVLFKSKIADSFVNNVAVTSGKTYYWKVITRDIVGNTSSSGVYRFTVQ